MPSAAPQNSCLRNSGQTPFKYIRETPIDYRGFTEGGEGGKRETSSPWTLKMCDRLTQEEWSPEASRAVDLALWLEEQDFETLVHFVVEGEVF